MTAGYENKVYLINWKNMKNIRFAIAGDGKFRDACIF
jgi:hypothetical protein